MIAQIMNFINSDLDKPLDKLLQTSLYEQTITMAVSRNSVNWAIHMMDENGIVGDVLNNICGFIPSNGALINCRTFDDLFDSYDALLAVFNANNISLQNSQGGAGSADDITAVLTNTMSILGRPSIFSRLINNPTSARALANSNSLISSIMAQSQNRLRQLIWDSPIMMAAIAEAPASTIENIVNNSTARSGTFGNLNAMNIIAQSRRAVEIMLNTENGRNFIIGNLDNSLTTITNAGIAFSNSRVAMNFITNNSLCMTHLVNNTSQNNRGLRRFGRDSQIGREEMIASEVARAALRTRAAVTDPMRDRTTTFGTADWSGLRNQLWVQVRVNNAASAAGTSWSGVLPASPTQPSSNLGPNYLNSSTAVQDAFVFLGGDGFTRTTANNRILGVSAIPL